MKALCSQRLHSGGREETTEGKHTTWQGVCGAVEESAVGWESRKVRGVLSDR